jgi:hypothetical protein
MWLGMPLAPQKKAMGRSEIEPADGAAAAAYWDFGMSRWAARWSG